jgi:hypothetical protein
MDDQRDDRDSGDGVTSATQFGLRGIVVIASWVLLWMGAWAWLAYLSVTRALYRPELLISLLTVIFTCPYAVFGYAVGRHKLGIFVGLVFSAVFLSLFIAMMPSD